MQVVCPRCGFVLVYTGQPPRFCSDCGQALSNGVTHDPDATSPEPDSATWSLDPAQTIPFPEAGKPRPAFPEAVGGYRLLRTLGGGGMGTVFEALDVATGRHVALKLIRPEFANSSDALERFRREGRLAGIISHPRCVFVLAADEEAGRPYIVMELMPGTNLHDLVAKMGPLHVSEAVALILDIIEGLEEAHRCGVIHRDVKPSNCFLDADGRVKVGDFGLSKSLVGDAHLTRSGAFLGTLLFAAPEQIRNEHVDHLADVYSVCATLYYLLTKRAPFEGGDAASTLARTVTDPLTPMRTYRPDLPSTLDEVVARGLARSRARRWQSLEELRQALLPFVPGAHSLGDVGYRCAAYTLDWLLLVPAEVTVNGFLVKLARRLNPGAGLPAGQLLLSFLAALLCGVVYFGLAEWLWGCSLGKYLCGLRVRTEDNGDRPRLQQALLRTTVFYACRDGPALLLGLLLVAGLRGLVFSTGSLTPGVVLAVVAVAALPILGSVAGLALVAASMRRSNGYRGLHELASGTRTIRLAPRRGRVDMPVVPVEGSHPAGMPENVGAFTVLGALRWEERERVLLAEDPVLQRRVWVWLRPQGETLPAGRAEVSRAARPRWVAGGVLDGWQWDAFVASPGGPFLGRRALSWARALEVLTQLTEELAASEAECTLPARLGLEQVWVQPDGRVLLLDTPIHSPALGRRLPAPARDPLDLLRQVAIQALEGKAPAPEELPRPLRAPVPGEAAALLNGLLGVGPPLEGLAAFRTELARVAEEPAEVPRPRRALGVALQAALLTPGLLTLFALGPLFLVVGFGVAVLGGVLSEDALNDTDVRVQAVCAQLSAQPEPLLALQGVARLDHDLGQREQLQKRLDTLAHEREVLLQSASWFIRRVVEPAETQLRSSYHEMVRQQRAEVEEEWEGEDSARFSEELLGLSPGVAEDLLGQPHYVVLVLAFWPLLWVAGSVLLRGGLSLRLAGLALVQADGRPAARWRCAWRTLLVWAPVVVLLALSLEADLWRVAALAADPDRTAGWAVWLAWLTWWLAAALAASYPWVAVRWADRGPHDVLAGTFVVPR